MANRQIAERTKKIIGQNIYRLRKESGRSVIDLTGELAMPRPYWYELETGTVNYTVERLEQVAKVLGVSVRDLFHEPRSKKRELAIKR